MEMDGGERGCGTRGDGGRDLVPFFGHGLDVGEEVGDGRLDRATGARAGDVFERHRRPGVST